MNTIIHIALHQTILYRCTSSDCNKNIITNGKNTITINNSREEEKNNNYNGNEKLHSKMRVKQAARNYSIKRTKIDEDYYVVAFLFF